MIHRIFAGWLLLLAVTAVACAEPDKEPAKNPDDTPGPHVVKITLPVKPIVPARALKYPLLPDPLDLTPGNAATLWMRAGSLLRENRRKYNDKEYTWNPIKDPPEVRKETQALIDTYRIALGLADQAARRDRCDWDLPPLTIKTVNELPFGEIQILRELIHLLGLRCRLELAAGQFDKALYTLQTGFALARHTSEAPTIIHSLVGIAFEGIMMGLVEDFIQQPGSPNLYWSLTALPSPFIDPRRAVEHELGTIFRSFPQIREMEKNKLTPEQVQALAEEMFTYLSKWGDLPAPAGWNTKLGIAALAIKQYPVAKKALIALGHKEEEVNAMPAVQVVALHLIEDYNREKDECVKAFSLPPWQAQPLLDQQAKRLKEAQAKHEGNVIVALLMPAIAKVHQASVRTRRSLEALRVIEAIRLHVATHEGKLPASLADITEVPLPTNPDTGKGFDAYYKLDGDKAVFELPPFPAGGAPVTGRKYEITRSR